MKAKIGGRMVDLDIEKRVRGGVAMTTTGQGVRIKTGGEGPNQPGLSNVRASAASGVAEHTKAPSPYKRVAVNIKGPFAFTLPMQIPSGKNAVQITRTGKRYPNKRFKAWREEAMLALPEQRPYFGDPVGLAVNYTPGDKIRRDVPGLLDALCHLIEHVGIVRDDAQVKNVDWTTFQACKGKAMCEVQIYELYQGG